MNALLRSVSALALVASALAAHAGLTVYTSRSAFLLATGTGLATADFQGLGGNSYQTLSNANAASIPAGVTFSSNGGNSNDLFVATANFGGDAQIASDSLFANFFGTPLNAALSPSINAFGSDVLSYSSPQPITVAVTASGGASGTFTVIPTLTAAAFFGVVGTNGTTISFLSFTPPTGYTAGIDNVRFGNVQATPEPATFVALSLGSLALLKRRKRA